MANTDSRRARRRLELIGNINLAGAVVSVLICVLVSSWWWRFSTQGFGGTWLTDVLGVFAAATALQSAAFLWACSSGQARPLLPAVLVAVLASVATLLAFWITPALSSSVSARMALFVPLTVTLLLWGLVGWARRIELDPDWKPRGQRHTPWLARTATGVFLVLGLAIAGTAQSQGKLEDAAEQFLAGWNAGDREALAPFVPSVDGKIQRALDRMRAEFGGDGPPQLELIERVDDRIGQPLLVLHSPQLVLRMRWHMPRPLGGWKILSIRRR